MYHMHDKYGYTVMKPILGPFYLSNKTRANIIPYFPCASTLQFSPLSLEQITTNTNEMSESLSQLLKTHNQKQSEVKKQNGRLRMSIIGVVY